MTRRLFVLLAALALAAPAYAQAQLSCQAFPCHAQLAWDAPSGSVDGYKVSLDGALVATVQGGTATTAAFDVPTVGSHTAGVRAFNSTGESADAVLAFTAALVVAVPGVPANLIITIALAPGPSIPAGTASPSGTTVPPASTIRDAAGNVWTLGGDGTEVDLNGQHAPNAGPCTKLGYFSGKVYAFADQWYRWDGAGIWTPVGANTPQ